MATLLLVLMIVLGQAQFHYGWFSAIVALDLLFTPIMVLIFLFARDILRDK